jgi:hypothetical protein
MWRYQMAVKGSEQELRWLNQQAQRGQLLRRIRGNWYQFQKTATRYQVFSEYVSGMLQLKSTTSTHRSNC